MNLTTNPFASSVTEYLEDDQLVFTGRGGTYVIEPWVDGSYYILRDGNPARDAVVAHLFDADAAKLIADQKARALY